MGKLRKRSHIERGQGLVEYVILLVLVAILAISILSLLGPAIGEVFSKITIVLRNPQDYAEIIATRDAEIEAAKDAGIVATQEAESAATQVAEAAATQEAEVAATYEAMVITSVSARREGDTGLRVYVTISKPAALTVTTSDSRSKAARCAKSCVIKVSGVSKSSGTVTVIASDGSYASAGYPSRIVSKILQPESIATATGTASGLALALYLGKSFWWKIGLKMASQCAAVGRTDAALTIFQRVITSGQMSSAKASGAWNLINESLIKHTASTDLINFCEVERGVAALLSSAERLEFYTKLGGLYNKVGRFGSALPVLKTAEEIFHWERMEEVAPEIQAALFGGLGTTYIRSGNDTDALIIGNKHLDMAQESVVRIEDEESRKASQAALDDDREETGQKLPLVRKHEQAWGSATIDDLEEDSPLHVDVTYTVTTSMGWGEAPVTGGKAKFKEFPVPQSLDSLAFDVAIWAEDMDVEQPWMRTLELDPASNLPAHVQFKLTPRAMGRKMIRIDFYYKLHWLQQITFPVSVMEAPAITIETVERTVEDSQASVQPLQVGMLLGLGGRGDRSFNDSAYKGLETAQQLYGIEFETVDSDTLEENISLLRQWAEADYDLIIAIGFHNGPAIVQVARSFPEKRFAIIDTEVEGENVWSAVFREHEADYVVGALAALIAGEEERVGFIGGVRTPIIHRIESAFSQGIESVSSDIVLDTIYVDRFDDEVMGEYFAEMLYARGANVIYQAAGGSGMGAIRAADRLGKLIISTGGDHSELAPAAVVTSRIKNVYRPVQDVIEATFENRFEGGATTSYGLANKGLSLTRVRREVVERLVEHIRPGMSLRDFATRMAEITESVTSGQIAFDFDEIEEMIPGSADDEQADAGSMDDTLPGDRAPGKKSASNETI